VNSFNSYKKGRYYNPQDGIKAVFDPSKKVVKNKLINIVKKLKNKGAQAIIMGCSEIPLVMMDKKIAEITMIDPTLILARALIKQVDPDKLKPFDSNLVGR
jgi:aspartate racemase